jgi:TolA-binding protein
MATAQKAEHKDWYEAIAEYAKLSVQDTKKYLQQLQIRPAPLLPRPKFLKLLKLSFSGKKTGAKYNGDDFSFCWDGLSSGVWCLASHKNFAGKSSVLEIALWALRGRAKQLQQDVRQWLKHVEVTFSIDADTYSVKFNVAHGKPQGVLVQLVADKEYELFAFDSDDSFENTMSRFMLETLNLERIPARRTHPGDTDKQTVLNGWLSFSNVFYVGGDHEYLLGDDAMNGMPGRLLQLFAGMPWVSTLALAQAAQSQEEQTERNRLRRSEEDRKAHEGTVQQLEQDLKAAQGHLAELSSDEANFLSQLDEVYLRISRLSAERDELQESLVDLRSELRTAKRASLADKQASLDMRETELARKVFNGLRPTCCPRCDQRIAAARFQQEEQSGHCSVCDRSIVAPDSDYETESFHGAEARAAASDNAVQEISDQIKWQAAQLSATEASVREERNRLSELDQKRSSFVQRRELELRVAKLEGALEERRKSGAAQESPDNHLLTVAKAAVHETKARVETFKTSFFEPLNTEIAKLGVDFGIEQLDRVQLDLAARLQVWKGGATTWFSKLSPGERLRLRVATIVAMLRVAQEKGIGRHPGLLIIDSPGAQESSETDVAILLKALNKLTSELDHLQLFVATANAELATQEVPEKNCRVAAVGKQLW